MKIFRTALSVGRGVQRLLQLLPTNRLLARLRLTTQVRWSLFAAAVLVPSYLLGAAVASEIATNGGPGWLHACVLCWVWNAMKFTAFGLWHPVFLARQRRQLRVRSRHAVSESQESRGEGFSTSEPVGTMLTWEGGWVPRDEGDGDLTDPNRSDDQSWPHATIAHAVAGLVPLASGSPLAGFIKAGSDPDGKWIDTLEALIDYWRDDDTVVAHTLGVSPGTVRYRVHTLQEMIDVNLNDPAQRLALRLEIAGLRAKS